MVPKQKSRNAKNSRGRARGQTRTASSENKDSACPIVAIGGSAGGFEATMDLLRSLPAKTGMAFVIVQHLDPHHSSRLAHLLRRATSMPVIELAETSAPQPNTVYVQPPNKCVTMKEGALKLTRRTERLNVAIDHFFESLAEARGSRAIGVLLSGTGTDGTAGLRAIKAAGGLAFAQSEQSAKFPDMPRSAIRAGFVDTILSPREIAEEIERIGNHSYIREPMTDGESAKSGKVIDQEADDLARVFSSLKTQIGVDFSSYKRTTLLRRIQRRMALHRIEKLSAYKQFLHNNKKEIEALFDDLLINVTHFFRDERVFRALQQRFLPVLLRKKLKHRGEQLRVWVPGCATGEEVYSLVICILETLGTHSAKIGIQIFGTDLSESTIDHARAGIYSSAIAKDVTPKRLKRFFAKRDGTYQINRKVRDLCTFARQDITADPPFSRLDLISCRNVLIYLSPQLHKRCIPQFHYALNPGGYLILGPAESVGMYEELFEPVDRKNKIYAKRDVPTPRTFDLQPYRGFEAPQGDARSTSAVRADFSDYLLEVADRIMLGAYAPAAVIIDSTMHVEQMRGRTEDYLEHPPDADTLNLLQLARPSMVSDLRRTIDRAMKNGKPTRKERVLVRFQGKTREVNIEVVPFKMADSNKSWMLVIFDETTKGARPGRLLEVLGRTAPQREMNEMRQELRASESAGKEMLSRNEELQLVNEELETAKEELQSTNEELTTLNDELSNRNVEMMQLTSDLDNLLTSVRFPIVMVDRALTVRRATPAARNAFNILPTDIGRRITDLRPNIDIPDLENILREVIGTLKTQQRKVKGNEGRDYSLHVRPYRTTDNKIDGAVITLVDVEAGKGLGKKKQ